MSATTLRLGDTTRREVRHRGAPCALLLAATALACASDPSGERAHRADRSGPIKVGVIWDFTHRADGFGNGVALAVEEVNAAGGANGRPLEVIKVDDKGLVKEGKLLAKSFAEDPDVVAVIGHPDSAVAVPASILYEYAGLLTIAPGMSSRRLSRDGFRLVFQTMPNAELVGSTLAAHAHARGLERLAIVYKNDAYGRAVANAFESGAEELRLRVAARVSFDLGSDQSYQRALRTLDPEDFAGVVLAARMPEASEMFAGLRRVGITAPVFGPDGLDDPAFAKSAEGVVVASVFHPKAPRPEVAAFTASYQTKFSALPDTPAAQGYDAVKLLAAAISGAKTAAPREVADRLRELEYVGVTGSHRFDSRGEVLGKAVLMKEVRGGAFELLEQNPSPGPPPGPAAPPGDAPKPRRRPR